MGASTRNIDMSGVKDRGNFNPKHIAEGDYKATVVKVEDAKPKGDDSGFMYLFTIKVDKYSQHSYPYYCKLQENQLWKLRNLLIAGGINVPKKKMKVDPNKVVGKSIGVTMEDDEYEGKMKSVISAVFPVHELADGAVIEGDEDFDEDSATPVSAVEDDDEPDEEPKAKKKKKAKDAEPAAEEPAKGKGKKKKKKDKENLEELDISDVA